MREKETSKAHTCTCCATKQKAEQVNLKFAISDHCKTENLKNRKPQNSNAGSGKPKKLGDMPNDQPIDKKLLEK